MNAHTYPKLSSRSCNLAVASGAPRASHAVRQQRCTAAVISQAVPAKLSQLQACAQQQSNPTIVIPHSVSVDASRRGLLSTIVAVAVLPLLLLLPTDAHAKLPPVKDPASNVGFLTNKEVDKKRKKANYVRAYDGHVSIQNKFTKAWTDVKCDLQVPGLLLLRDQSGEVFYLGYAGLKQVDLSDDQVVAAIATDDWENAMIPVEGPGESGEIERLEMTREGFYQLVSLTSGEDFEAELVPQAAAQKK